MSVARGKPRFWNRKTPQNTTQKSNMSAEAAFRRRDVNASDAIAELLHPNMGYREQQKRKGIEPKDFERANRLLIKKQQAVQRERKLAEAAKVHEAFKLKKFKSVQPRVFEQLTREELAATEPPKRHDFLRRGASTAAFRQRKKQQEEEAKSKASRPSTAPDSARATAGGSFAPEKPKRQHTKPPVPTREELEELSNQLAKLHHRDKPDFVNANAWEVIKQTPNRPRDDADGKGVVHESFGRIPEYLLQRKEQWASEEEERRRNAPDPDCPPGMVRLPEDERVSTLAVLKQSLEEAQQQVSRLPLRIETASQIRRKNDLEQRLREIEDAIKVFSKPKVYVAKPETEDRSTAPSPVRRRQSNAAAA